MKTSKALRRAIDRHRGSRVHQSFRYPSALKQCVAEYTRSQRLAGVPYAALVVELGLPLNTLRRWCEESSAGRLASVELSADPASDGPVLVTRSGHRVEGLSLRALCEVLERLS